MSSSQLIVRVQTTLAPPGLRLRSQPNTISDTLAFEAPGASLTVIEAQATAQPKIGVNGQWLQVRDANALVGYVAAWYVEIPLAGGISAPAKPTVPTVSLPSPQSLVDAINAERVKHNLPKLNVNSILTSDAQKQAEYMASSGQITHEDAQGRRPFQRHLDAGFPLAGDLSLGGFASENIVTGTNMSIQEAIAYWYSDDPHTHTMLGDKYTDCGAGVAAAGDMLYYCFDAARSTTASSKLAAPPTPPPADAFVVYVPKDLTSGLRIRKDGNANAGLVRVANAGEWLAVQEPVAAAKAKIGVQDKWLKVKDKSGNVGYVAAWMVSAI